MKQDSTRRPSTRRSRAQTPVRRLARPSVTNPRCRIRDVVGSLTPIRVGWSRRSRSPCRDATRWMIAPTVPHAMRINSLPWSCQCVALGSRRGLRTAGGTLAGRGPRHELDPDTSRPTLNTANIVAHGHQHAGQIEVSPLASRIAIIIGAGLAHWEHRRWRHCGATLTTTRSRRSAN